MGPGSEQTTSPGIVVTRFTAPSAGDYNITGTFTDLQASTVTLYVLVNGLTVSTSTGLPLSFSDTTTLASGGTVDFVVDGGGTNQSDDVVGLAATISSTPLPSTWLMLLSGFLGLGFVAYRGSKKKVLATA